MEAHERPDYGLTRRVIGCAIEVHRLLGPGLLESAYEQALAHELSCAGLHFARQIQLPVNYKGLTLSCGYRLDLLVENRLILELKSVEALQAVHQAQLLSYLRLSGYPYGLLINFNSYRLKEGIKRLIK
jgi:GxxExxY protein